ncbi:MAG: DUF1800 domain-containing protein [Chitinophagaceae bacterium]|nr:DUF1800 domain-containing protein [Chitinophagaceae bacterium]HMN32608.1 DUF1800 domain-containing protein [Chitinophagaceae bacterium]
MGEKNRRQFIESLTSKKPEKSQPYDINKDEVFLKYSNKTSPLALKKSRAGLTQYSGAWTTKQQIHLLRRTLFGFTPNDVSTINGLTMSQAVDLIVNSNPAVPAPPINYYESIYPDPTGVPLGATWVNAPYGDGTVNYYRYLSTEAWWMKNILNQGLSIQEKMMVFWHNHFVCEENVVGDSRLLYDYINLIRTNALGNFKTFVKAITKNPMMLFYLNGHYNIKNSPDENYAREVQELFTVGKGANLWNEDDVKAVAKVLTGFRADTVNITYYFDSNKHESGNKTFSSFYNNTVITGQAGAAGENELDDLLNMIFAQDQTVAKYICRKIYRFFVYYNIDANIESTIITGLANTLISNNWNIKPVLLQLFKSDHFYDSTSMDCLITNPMDYYLGMMKALRININPAIGVVDETKAYYRLAILCEEAAMSPGNPPSVAGWPSYYQEPQFHEMWINSDTLPKRMRYTDALFTNSGIYISGTYKLLCDVLYFASTLSNPSDPDVLINDCVRYLLALDLTQTSKDYYKNILTNNNANSYWTQAWNDYINNPGNATYENIVKSRLRLMLTKLLQLAEHHLI